MIILDSDKGAGNILIIDSESKKAYSRVKSFDTETCEAEIYDKANVIRKILKGAVAVDKITMNIIK